MVKGFKGEPKFYEGTQSYKGIETLEIKYNIDKINKWDRHNWRIEGAGIKLVNVDGALISETILEEWTDPNIIVEQFKSPDGKDFCRTLTEDELERRTDPNA